MTETAIQSDPIEVARAQLVADREALQDEARALLHEIERAIAVERDITLPEHWAALALRASGSVYRTLHYGAALEWVKVPGGRWRSLVAGLPIIEDRTLAEGWKLEARP